MHSLRLLLLAVLPFFSGRQSEAPPARVDNFPELPKPRQLTRDILRHNVVFVRDKIRTRIWIYIPAEAKKGAKLPCILVAPAGSALFHGMGLGGADRPEHLPYVRAGCVVVAYSVSGPLKDDFDENGVVRMIDRFVNADGGVANAKAALDYALAKIDLIDRERIFTSGHSSAATLSLQVAESEDRIRGCIAFAPVVNIAAHLEPIFALEPAGLGISRLKDWAESRSPAARVKELTCPLFLFHAEDDSNVPVDQSRSFADAVTAAGNEQVNFVTVPRGDHYDSMLKRGIPEAIRWLRRF